MNLQKILQEKFKKQAFREGQQSIIENALEGHNIFATIPTGGGKSLCYQFLAGLEQRQEPESPKRLSQGETGQEDKQQRKGQVLVISPLVALIDDQHKEALELGLNSVKIHSNLSSKEKQKFYENLSTAEILFLTPERLIQPEFWQRSEEKGLNVKYLVIDEAHCMSQWGSDFRPDYTRIPDYLAQMGHPTILALTATATVKVKEDIIQRLKTQSRREWFTYAAPLERPNIDIKIFECFSFVEKIQRMTYWFQQKKGPTIVYFSLVQNLEQASHELSKLNIAHTKYHGQLPAPLKVKNQKLFFENQSEIMLATPAFGLGVNKADIRLILHFELPQSIEAYYQEVGRAGRDGKPSEAELFYHRDDAEIHIDFLKWNHPEPGFITSVYDLIRDYPQRYLQEGPDFLREKLNFYNKRDFRVETALNLLKRWDVLTETSEGPKLAPRAQLEMIPDIDEGLYSLRKKSAQMRLLQLIQLIEKNKDDASEIQKDIINYFIRP